MSDIKPPKPPLITPPHPADRPPREEMEKAIAAGLTPIVVDGGEMRALLNPQRILIMAMDDYRYQLRSTIAEVSWSEAIARCRSDSENGETHKGNLLMWGYKALCAERDAAAQFAEMAGEFKEAAAAANELAFALRQDGRHVDGIPLRLVQEINAARYQRHVDTFGTAFRGRIKLATKVLRILLQSWFGWLSQKGVFVAEPHGKSSRYNIGLLSIPDLVAMADRLFKAGELADGIVRHGVAGVLRKGRKGRDGRWPVLFDAWLVQQGRIDAPKMGATKLARLLMAHELAEPGARVAQITDRLKKAVARHPQPVPLYMF